MNMATQWYWREQGNEKGPVTFKELIAMVQDRALNEEDEVRDQYSTSWQSAESVVGLFYMARRLPVERQESPRVESDGAQGEIVGPAPGELQTLHFYRLAEVERVNTTPPPSDQNSTTPSITNHECITLASAQEEITYASDGTPVASGLAEAIEAATEEWDRRHIGATAGPIPLTGAQQSAEIVGSSIAIPWRVLVGCGDVFRTVCRPFLAAISIISIAICQWMRLRTLCCLLERIASRQTLTWWFRSCFAALTAGVVAYGVVSFSSYAEMRFPESRQENRGNKYVPFYGRCSSADFYVIFTDAVVVAAVVGYFVARGLEAMADD